MLGALPDADVSLTVDESNKVEVKCGTSDFSILGLPAEEFPMLPEVREEVCLTLDRELMRESIRRTILAVSVDKSRAILTGVFYSRIESGLKMVSTDTHRLCFQDCSAVESQGTVNAIVPGRAMNELMRILPEADGTVSVSISGSQILFKVDDTVLLSRLIEGQFPNFEKVIPTEYTRRLIIPTEHLLQSVKRAAIVARDNSQPHDSAGRGRQVDHYC